MDRNLHKKTRNTEFKKYNKSTGKLEAECRFLTEERTLEMLSSEKLKKIKYVAKSCNIATKGSKLDILLKIKEVINKNDAIIRFFQNCRVTREAVCHFLGHTASFIT